MCVMSPWIFTVYMDALMERVKMGNWEGIMGVRFSEEERNSLTS